MTLKVLFDHFLRLWSASPYSWMEKVLHMDVLKAVYVQAQFTQQPRSSVELWLCSNLATTHKRDLKYNCSLLLYPCNAHLLC